MPYDAKYIMTVFDVAFLLGTLAALFTLAVAGLAAARSQATRARQLLVRVAAGVAAYFAILVAVSLAAPGRVIGPGQDLCSDDWCISLTGAVRTRAADGDHLDVTFRLASRAARVAQRERHVVARLLDDRGTTYDSEVTLGLVPFDVLLAPLETRAANRAYRIPSGTKLVGVVIARDGAGWFPRCCIINDAGSLLHRPTVLALP